LRGKNPLSDIILPNLFETSIPGSPTSPSGSPVDRTFPQSASSIPNTISSNGNNILSTAFNGVTDFVSDVFNLGNATTIPNGSFSPGSGKNLSAFERVTPNFQGSRKQKLTEVQDRISILETQLKSDSENSIIIGEINQLKTRLQLEFKKIST